MSWAAHAPTTHTAYKDHALSSKIRHWALREMQVAKFTKPEPGFGRRQGQSHTLTHISSLGLTGPVDPDQRLPIVRPTISTTNIVLQDWGAKIELTEWEGMLTYFDMEQEFQKVLKDQMKRVMDLRAKQAFAATPLKIIPTTANGLVYDTDGTASTPASRNLSVRDLLNARDYMASSTSGKEVTPKWSGNRYVMIGSVKACRGIQDSPEYESWQAPTTAQPLVEGHIRDIAGFSIYETNHETAFSETLGTNSVLGEAILFGEDAVAMIVVQEPTIRVEADQDLGRFKAFGWVGRFEYGLIRSSATNARVLHVTSA